MNKHIATSPDGAVVTRNSKTKIYGICVFTKNIDNVWVLFGWSRDILTAQKLVSSERSALKRYGCGGLGEVAFVETVVA